MSRIATRIRGYVNGPPISEHYGEWGALRPDQRRQIRELCDTCDMFEKAADEFAKRSKWISVYERLPDVLQEVLVYRGNHIGNLMNAYTYVGGDMWKDEYGFGCRREDEGITHWMPLPEAPKMKGGNDK